MHFQYGGKKSAAPLANQVVLLGDAAEIASEYSELFEGALRGSLDDDTAVFAAMANASLAARHLTTNTRRFVSSI